MNYYDKEWNKAAVPYITDLSGLFQVSILTGYFRIVEPFMKEWQKTIEGTKGHNTANGKTMGQFELQFTKDVLYLKYSVYPKQRPRYWTRLRDEIRMTAPGHFIGRIWMDFLGKPRFMGYFALTSIVEISEKEAQLILSWNHDFPALIAYVSNLWVLGFDSGYVMQFDDIVEMVTGSNNRNVSIISALKNNLLFWQFNCQVVDSIGFYQFKLPEELL